MLPCYFAEVLLRVLPGSNLGPWPAGIQMHHLQTARSQKMPQGDTHAVPEPATATATAITERRVSDARQERRPTA